MEMDPREMPVRIALVVCLFAAMVYCTITYKRDTLTAEEKRYYDPANIAAKRAIKEAYGQAEAERLYPKPR